MKLTSILRKIVVEKIVLQALRRNFLDSIVRPTAYRFGYSARTHRQRYYAALAVAFLVAIFANAIWQKVATDSKSESIDLAVRMRLSSPAPDPKIIILDVDERSLAVLAEEHGRWPWPRIVLAEAIANVSDAGVKNIVFNVMMSDADKSNPQSDLIFNEIAASTPNAVFPLIRLNPQNDPESQVQAQMLSGVRLREQSAAASTIAVLFPIFPGTHDKLGVNNLTVDGDGVVRRYSVWLKEKGYDLPSMPLRSAILLGRDVADLPDEILLNWRNKRGDYRRISFADFYLSTKGKASIPAGTFKDATVVISVSAPGIATTKGTASSPLLDDGVIIATAIDDLTNRTWLRLLPAWTSAVVSSLLILTLALAFARGVSDKTINGAFVAAQSSLVGITIGSASYTVYLADLSQPFMFGFTYFFLAKVYAIVDRSSQRGMPLFSNLQLTDTRLDRFSVFGFYRTHHPASKLRKLKVELEKYYGVRNVVIIDNAFNDENLFGQVGKDLEFFIVFTDESGISASENNEAKGRPRFKGFSEPVALEGVTITAALTPAMRADRSVLTQELGRALLNVSDRLINLSSSG